MIVDAFDPSRDLVSVTPMAAMHFRSQLAKATNAVAVRLSVKESGCTGYKYIVDLVPAASDNDLTQTVDGDLTLYIDLKSLPMIKGITLDYVLEGVNRELKFINPNAKDLCGCGESFSVS